MSSTRRALRLVEALLEGFKEKQAQFVEAGNAAGEVDAALGEFKKLKDRSMLAAGENDIDRYQTFQQLQAALADARTRKRSPKAAVAVDVGGAPVLFQDERVMAVELTSAEDATQLSSGTKWCISDPKVFDDYQKAGARIAVIVVKDERGPFSRFGLTWLPHTGGCDIRDRRDDKVTAATFERVAGHPVERFRLKVVYDPKSVSARLYRYANRITEQEWKRRLEGLKKQDPNNELDLNELLDQARSGILVGSTAETVWYYLDAGPRHYNLHALVNTAGYPPDWKKLMDDAWALKDQYLTQNPGGNWPAYWERLRKEVEESWHRHAALQELPRFGVEIDPAEEAKLRQRLMAVTTPILAALNQEEA